jgi:hypothetical protein
MHHSDRPLRPPNQDDEWLAITLLLAGHATRRLTVPVPCLAAPMGQMRTEIQLLSVF